MVRGRLRAAPLATDMVAKTGRDHAADRGRVATVSSPSFRSTPS